MDDTDFHAEQMGQFTALAERIASVSTRPGGEPLASVAETLQQLSAEPGRIMDEAPALIARLLTTAPQVAEFVPRDLLWYLGGDCLHYMPDDEIERFTQLDEQRRDAMERGEVFNWRERRAQLLGLQ
ncbi:MAG: PA2817 family protein [Pseudomonadota bacterium]